MIKDPVNPILSIYRASIISLLVTFILGCGKSNDAKTPVIEEPVVEAPPTEASKVRTAIEGLELTGAPSVGLILPDISEPNAVLSYFLIPLKTAGLIAPLVIPETFLRMKSFM